MSKKENPAKLEAGARFADYVTQTAFNLSLSKSQVIALTAVANGQARCDAFRVLGQHDCSLVAGNALRRRGLVYSPDPSAPGLYELTQAGEHVFELLKLAGLVARIEAKLTEAA